jgi:hypothetical protein
MISKILTRRLNQLEARLPTSTRLSDLHTIFFLGAGDEAATLTLQLGPNGTGTWTDLTDPGNPRIWTASVRRRP